LKEPVVCYFKSEFALKIPHATLGRKDHGTDDGDKYGSEGNPSNSLPSLIAETIGVVRRDEENNRKKENYPKGGNPEEPLIRIFCWQRIGRHYSKEYTAGSIA